MGGAPVDRGRPLADAPPVITLGVQTWGTALNELFGYWAAVERRGFARITYGDGLWPWTHDGWVMLGVLASTTRRVRLGPAVTYVFDPAAHHPVWLAKRAATVDQLSNGRLDLRVGVGAEHDDAATAWRRCGIPYPPAGQRVARLDEAVAIIRRLLAGETVTHEGAFHSLLGARVVPGPVQAPTPPIWIAAMGPRALDVVARQADGWEASYVGPAEFRRRWQALRIGLERAGRDAGAFRRSVEVDVVLNEASDDPDRALARFCESRRIGADHPVAASALAGEPAAVIEQIAAYEAAGATDLMLGFADFPATAMLERFASDVLPAVTRGGRRDG